MKCGRTELPTKIDGETVRWKDGETVRHPVVPIPLKKSCGWSGDVRNRFHRCRQLTASRSSTGRLSPIARQGALWAQMVVPVILRAVPWG